MRICFLIRQLNEGGAQRQLLELVDGLARRSHEVTVLTFYPGGIFWDAFAALPGVRLACLHKAGRFDFARFAWRLAARLRALRPELVHGYLMGGNLFASLAPLLLPGVRVVWGIRTSDASGKAEAGYDKRLRGLERMASNLSHRIIVNSRAGHAYYAKSGFPVSKMEVVPNGVDTARFVPAPALGREVRAGLGLGPGPVIGIVGRLVPVKDHGTFLAAAARFARRRPSAAFVVAGGGPEEYAESLKRSAAALGIGDQVFWLGSRKDVERLYPAFDLFVSASRVEGFPNAIAEAMACGVPVVATDAGDSAQIVGDTGLIVPTGQAARMAEAWEDLLGRIGPELSRRARERIEAEFAVERLVRNTEAILLDVRSGG